MNEFLYGLTKYLLGVLKDRGVNIDEIAPKSKKEIAFETNRGALVTKQLDISDKRLEIANLQSKLLLTVEPSIFSILGKAEDSWEKTTVTKVWLESIRTINSKMAEHATMVNEFNDMYTKMMNPQPKNNTINPQQQNNSK